MTKVKMIFIGIDPGQTGAIAVIDWTGEILFLKDWPCDEIGAADIVRTIQGCFSNFTLRAALEKVHSMPKQGVSSSFKFGTNFGIWKGILASFQIPFLEPTPQAWQKGVVKKAQDTDPKIAATRRLWPKVELEGPRGGIKDGRADALLIADWCRRQYV